jgi:hypothetical protein
VHTLRQQSTKEGRCLATSSRATMEATSVFFVVCPKATIGAAVFSLRSVSWKCFLWSVHGLYKQGHQPACLVSSESSAEEWEPVGFAGGPGPWRNSAGVVTQLWESVVIVRRLGKYFSKLWSCKSVYTVIVCNCVWSNKSSCQTNNPSYIVATHTRDSIFL